MLAPGRPQLSPIARADLDQVGVFLHTHLNRRVSARSWTAALTVPWAVDAPNHGFKLTFGSRIVGVYLAFYADRVVEGTPERFCNLGAWCVLDEHRAEGLRLVRAILAQPGYTFTDLSPSGNVVALNERLRFRHLDTTTAVVPVLPWLAPRGVRISSDPAVIAATLSGPELQLYRDHAATAAAIHVVIRAGDRSCYVALRRDRRKRIPGFGSFLYVSDPAVLRRVMRPLGWHLLVHHRIVALLAEERITGPAPRGSVRLPHARPKMIRSERLSGSHLDYLYSELACVAW